MTSVCFSQLCSLKKKKKKLAAWLTFEMKLRLRKVEEERLHLQDYSPKCIFLFLVRLHISLFCYWVKCLMVLIFMHEWSGALLSGAPVSLCTPQTSCCHFIRGTFLHKCFISNQSWELTHNGGHVKQSWVLKVDLYNRQGMEKKNATFN